ncbi:GAF and ANTAR domain-containing protein [Actinomycetospora callitridis]|uniref:GAF and ANTAR domain-containing protein n=1 Tax=Actinomycetospora callitridis TaxID=913944 RepID=UPI002366597C|nr:GAF and ANTAR domain-containing protein [Actinomycetospora callitridis]MDD7916559.1 ANTAR domain-containing protein [Actinomycetospora callitridis]
MDVGHELDELIDLIDRLRRDVADVGGPRPDPGVAGPGAGAAENRSIAGARAALAREQAQRVREGLAEVRERTRTLAEVNRAGQARRAVQGRATATGTDPAPPAVAAAPMDALRAAARNLGNVTDAQGLAERVVAGALTSVPGAERAALHIAPPAGATSVRAASDTVAEELEAAQTAAGEGPGIEVLESGGRVHVPDTAGETRWPDVIARAREAGVGAVLALDVSCAAVRGALVLYAARAEAFGGASRATAALFTDYVAVALAAQTRIDAMTNALSSRDLIGQAKGILMARQGLDADGAFALLAQSSQQRNVKLVQVARELVGDALGG